MAALSPVHEVDQMLKGRFDNPFIELHRIPHLYPTIGVISSQVEKYLNPVPQAKAVFLQSLVIKAKLKRAYRIFLHGQSTKWIRFLYVLNSLLQTNCPTLDRRRFEFLRLPKPADLERFEFYKSGKGLTGNPSAVFDHNRDVREDLISVSADWETMSLCESAISFLRRNTNMLREESDVDGACHKAISHFYPNFSPKAIDKIVEQTAHVFREFTNELAEGRSLIVICVPKNKQPPFYRAHAGGRACLCYPDLNELEFLEDLQQGNRKDLSQCYDSTESLQYRIYAPLLKPGEDLIYPLCSMRFATQRQLKGSVHQFIEQLDRSIQVPKSLLHTNTVAFFLFKQLEHYEAYRSLEPVLITSIWNITSFL